MNKLIGTHDILFVTLDTLRYDAAQAALNNGLTPQLAAYLPNTKWEKRETPGNFTYAAHQSFFAGFLPTPLGNPNAPRLFAASFPGSETTNLHTFKYEEATFIQALNNRGYHTACIGGVGFFNKQTPLGSALPSLFAESHWSPHLGVTVLDSTKNQVSLAITVTEDLPTDKRLLMFVNISAIHQPNCIYSSHKTEDSVETQIDALAYVDKHLPSLIHTLAARAPLICIICSDHGTAYGEGGCIGHRHNHPVVTTVPYAEFIVEERGN